MSVTLLSFKKIIDVTLAYINQIVPSVTKNYYVFLALLTLIVSTGE